MIRALVLPRALMASGITVSVIREVVAYASVAWNLLLYPSPNNSLWIRNGEALVQRHNKRHRTRSSTVLSDCSQRGQTSSTASPATSRSRCACVHGELALYQSPSTRRQTRTWTLDFPDRIPSLECISFPVEETLVKKRAIYHGHLQ